MKKVKWYHQLGYVFVKYWDTNEQNWYLARISYLQFLWHYLIIGDIGNSHASIDKYDVLYVPFNDIEYKN